MLKTLTQASPEPLLIFIPLLFIWVIFTIVGQCLVRRWARVNSLGAIWPGVITILAGVPAAGCLHLLVRAFQAASLDAQAAEKVVLTTFSGTLIFCAACFTVLLVISPVAVVTQGPNAEEPTLHARNEMLARRKARHEGMRVALQALFPGSIVRIVDEARFELSDAQSGEVLVEYSCREALGRLNLL